MCKKTRSPPPWSEIPPEILQMIGDSTGSPIYYLKFRAVCKSWRNSFPLLKSRGFKNIPLKLPHHPSLSFGHYGFIRKSCSFYIVPTTSYVIQPTNGSFKGSSLLITADELNPGRLSLRYPLSASYRGRLGNSSSKWLNLLENRVSVLDQGFSLRILDVRPNDCEENDDGDGYEIIRMNYDLCGESEKAVILSNPCCEDDLLVLVLFRGGKLVALRVRDAEWKVVFDGKASKCADIVKFKEEVYGIDLHGRAFFVDYDYEDGDVNIVNVAPIVKGSEVRGKRLVVDRSSGKLYMIIRETFSSGFKFFVYKLNEDGRVWNKVKSLGDRMFFVGVNFSFCATVQDFPGLSMSCMHSLPRNCIFFSKGSFIGCGYEDNGDRLLFGAQKEGTGMNIGRYFLRDQCATGLLDAAYFIMFSPPF